MTTPATALWHPEMELTRYPTTATEAGVFVDETGKVNVTAGGRCLGVSSPQSGDLSATDVVGNGNTPPTGKENSIIVIGIGVLKMGSAAGAVGAEIASDVTGRGVAAVATNYVQAIAEEAWTALNQYIRVRLVQYKI